MKKILLPLLIATIIVGAGIYLIIKNKDTDPKSSEQNSSSSSAQPQLKIINRNSNSRSVAVMINNHPTARKNHAGLQDAYIVYEMIVEGGLTRYMAIFKDASLTRVGSVRSARSYYIDYALENDALFVHWGGSPQAYQDITSLKVNDIDGIASAKPFFRDSSLDVATEHTGFVNLVKLMTYAKDSKKYRVTSDQDTLLNYSIDEIALTDGTSANDITIKYSNSVTTSYKYDSENKVYLRFVNDAIHKDAVTKKQYTAKNIIIYSVSNSTISDDDKGRQELNNIGSGTGTYCTDGLCKNIKWSKTSRSSKTKYTYEDGKTITVNDGNTYIQIYPSTGKLTIE